MIHLVGLLCGWLIGRMGGWLVCRLVDWWLVCWLVGSGRLRLAFLFAKLASFGPNSFTQPALRGLLGLPSCILLARFC